MAFHPYRQQGTSGHMGVHKHQGHLFFDILRKDFIVKQAPQNDINT